MSSFLVVCTILLAVATVLPLSRQTHWLIRAMDFPRLQITVFALILLGAMLLFLDLQLPASWLMLTITTICFLWQLWWIIPYTSIFPPEVKSAIENDPEKTVRILTSNVLTPNHNAGALIDLVHKYAPDILVTLESDQWWEEHLDELEESMPYTVKCPLDNLYGMHLYSKLPLQEAEIAFLVEKDIPSIHASFEMPNGVQVRAHFLHPAPPSPTENTKSAERDSELVIVARSIATSGQPVIIAGDLNDVAWSSTTRLFRKISGLLDPRVGRGMFNTFHAHYPFLRWPLDHLFHSDHFTLRSIERLPTIGSDHFPLFTCLVYTPKSSSSQEGLVADHEDKQRAKEIATSNDVSKHDVPQPNEHSG